MGRRRESTEVFLARLDRERRERDAVAKVRREKYARDNPVRPELHDLVNRWYAIRMRLVDELLPLIRYALEQEQGQISAQLCAAANLEVGGIRVPLCQPDTGWYFGVRREC